jgi:hypothetical protein
MKFRFGSTMVLASALAGGLLPAPAIADEFTVENSAPTVSSPALTMPGTQTAFEPDGGASDEVYAYGVTVGDAQTLNDLNTVAVCLYHSLKEDGSTAGEGDATCGSINPQNTVKLTWTRSTNAFSISAGSSTYWSLGSGTDASSAPADLAATTGSLAFRFKVGEAMREGTWTAKVTATDTSAAAATDSTATKTVAAYSAITTRVSQNFGTVAATSGATATASPTVTANGATTVSLTAGNFTDGTYTFALKTDGATSTGPATGQVTFDCMAGGTFTEASATRIATAATSLGTATSTGTAEGGTAAANTCRIKHGGGRPVATYSFAVVNAVSNA